MGTERTTDPKTVARTWWDAIVMGAPPTTPTWLWPFRRPSCNLLELVEGYFQSSSPEIRDRVADELSLLMEPSRFRFWTRVRPRRFAEWRRELREGRVTPPLAPERLAELLERPPTIAVRLLSLASHHSDGHVREQALRHMAGLFAAGRAPRPEMLLGVLPRLADWVREVRVAAAAALRMVLPSMKLPDLEGCAPFCRRLRASIHVDAGAAEALFERLRGLALRPEGRAFLAAQPVHSDLWDIIAIPCAGRDPDLWAIIQNHAWLPQLRGLAARHAPVADWDANTWRQVLADPVLPVRWLWLKRLADLRPQPDFAADVYREVLADADSGWRLRRAARTALVEMGIDPNPTGV